MNMKTSSKRWSPGATVTAREVSVVTGNPVRLPDSGRVCHLQFRRFAGCPVCDLHLRSFDRRHDEIVAAGICEVAIFHSTPEELRKHGADRLPFVVVADPDRHLYREFAVETGRRALLDPRAWPAILRAIARSVVLILRGERSSPELSPHGGRLGLPADFLIAANGLVLACKYGEHAFDQWSVDEVLKLVQDEVAGLDRTALRRLPAS
jgi:peroxiredoxin